uniref:Rieske domain-containing protein n=1 Tax=Oryza barthii TaxID=65489 RepID=A0A0D3FQE4_9ORYZ
MGLRVVVAWFGGGGEWRVVDDACPHRLAPLSEGRVDGKGRLQCAYHGWCFDGHGSCQFIPQAPALGPPVHKNSKACVASYPSVVQNNILWFYPRTEPEYRDVLQRKRPPYFPDLDDPSFNTVFGVRDFPYGYRNAQAILLRNGHIGMQLDILCRGSIAMQNLMDPAHVPYAHKGLFPQFQDKEDPGRYNIHLLSTVEFDQERGGPVKMKIEEANIDGFLSIQGENWGHFRFIAPCTINRSELPLETLEKQQQQPQGMLVFLCIPVAPGRSRVIWAFPQSVSAWPDKFIPRWLHHMVTNTILDSDLYLLHIEERNFAAVGVDKWQKACYVPTSSDNMIITFRNWFRKYCKHQCTSCSAALKWMRAMEVALQVASVAVVGFLAAGKGTTVVTSAVQRAAVVAAAALCFAASRWLANFIEKSFYFQDYVHAYNAMAPVSLPLLSRARPPLLLRDAGVKLSTVRLPPPWRQQWKHTSGERRRRLSMPASAVAAETPPPHARAEEEEEAAPAVGGGEEGRFEWLDQWYPVAPVCDLDPRKPHGKMVMGLRVVAWFDGGGGEWRVVDDACPHRLAPLSEGRVDGKGRLQCAYHGWCFDGHGSCQFIPQAPALGPPVHKNSKACVASYPSVVQNNILWFYPRSEPEYKEILQRKRPPYFPDLDDPSFNTVFGVRDLFYGTEQAKIDGFLSVQEDDVCYMKFDAPCTLYGKPFRTKEPQIDQGKEKKKKQPEAMTVFLCVPVAPGRSRLIWAFPRNVDAWLDNIIPRWLYHIVTNIVLDSDSYLLHIEERNFATVGLDNWHKACYVPTSSDNMVITFRNWFRKYCKHQIGWATPMANQLPPTPTKDQVLERSHVMQCTSCSAALKKMKALEVALQVASVAIVGFLAVAKGSLAPSVVRRAAAVSTAVLCFAASRWLASFIEKSFYFQDYVHAYKYELLVENFMDPAHVPYAHRGQFPHEGGLPIKMNIEELNIAGFHSNPEENWGYFKFIAPVTLIGSPFRAKPVVDQDNNNTNNKKQPEVTTVFFCIPVSPGRCRVIWANGYNLDGWFDKMIPRWWLHIKTNQVLDSDSSVLHIEERNYAAFGLDNWHKACYVPTSSDNLIIAFRNWFKKYCNNQVGWLTPMVNQLPPASTRVEVYERYWSHVMQCTSCSAALKWMRALEVALQVASVAVVGFLAAGKGTVVTSGVQRAAVVAAVVLCFAASRWLAGFIEKTFYFEDYVLADNNTDSVCIGSIFGPLQI